MTKAVIVELLEKIKAKKDRTFAVPEIETFMNEIKGVSLKARLASKTDINIVIHDLRTNQQPLLGVSIKSQIGNPATLLSAGKTTNFIFKVSEILLDENEVNSINKIDSKNKIRDRINSIINIGGTFYFIKTEQKIFSKNLQLIDSILPEIIAQLVFSFYKEKTSDIRSLVDNIQVKNPINFDLSNNHKFYSYKIKRFLTDITLGMMPSKVWTGKYDATGGYLIVKEDGEILCYHIYNRNEFENYLLNNTKLDTASCNRHDFGIFYKENGDLYFKLNLQIRFKKIIISIT